jgi:hypothetical protein
MVQVRLDKGVNPEGSYQRKMQGERPGGELAHTVWSGFELGAELQDSIQFKAGATNCSRLTAIGRRLCSRFSQLRR